MRILWHRRDLRVADNASLARAAEGGPVVPLFVLDDALLEYAGPPRAAFLRDALASLRAAYRERGSDLLVVRGDPVTVLPAAAREHGADRVVWGADYSGLARRRDRRVREALADSDVDCEAVHDAVHHEPGAITTTAGEPYSAFRYFWEKWRDREKADPVPVPDPDRLAAVRGDPLPPDEAFGTPPTADVPAAGTGAARDRLAAFCDGPIYRYDEARDRPAVDGTSRLSAHLSFGTVGVREVYAATERALAAVGDGAGDDGPGGSAGDDGETGGQRDAEGAGSEAADPGAGVAEFRRQLAWREFYAQVLAANPDMVRENLQAFERPVEWRNDPAELQAWKDGETGFPLVDAGMRQLRAAAWMHNRVRMVAAAFLVKDLLVDWRRGYEWFRERLVDHDPANEAGGWQWAASTGADAQPYFRVFNPATQCERHDPEGAYVREHVPELRDAPTGAIHDWPSLDAERRAAVAPEYTAPIVDHAERREAAIDAFERARGTDTDG